MLSKSWYVLLSISLTAISKHTQEGDVNPFTKLPHTLQYKKILVARKKLPVYAQMEEFYKMVRYFLRST